MNINDFWSPFEKTIYNFSDVLEIINKLTTKTVSKQYQYAWRGQVDASWALHSSLYRRCLLTKNIAMKEDAFSDHELQILKDLQKWGLHSPSNHGRLSILKQLAMLQHYGAPTRLIDVSFNPLVGLWFAVEEQFSNGTEINGNVDSRLFAIDVTKRLINEDKDLIWWEDALHCPWFNNSADHSVRRKWRNEWTTSVYAWKPPKLDDRIAAQNGGFLFGGVAASSRVDGTTFQFPNGNVNGRWTIDEGRRACCLALRPHKFETDRGGVGAGALFTFKIKASAKVEIRNSLQKMFGYSHETMYPDYTGFASFGVPRLRMR